MSAPFRFGRWAETFALSMALFTAPLLAQSDSSNTASVKGWPSPVSDRELRGFLLFDLLEYEPGKGPGALRWDVVGWYGGDWNRLWVKSEGRLPFDPNGGKDIELQALYGRLVAAFFDLQAGLRYDQRWDRFGSASRVFAVLALQGIAPYRFDIEPSLFMDNEGNVSARLTMEQDYWFTQRLIAQTRLETDAALQTVERFGVGSGLSDLTLGLRLRYHLVREFAPYLGVEWVIRFGKTADFARRDGESASRVLVVAGLRAWL